MAKAIICPICKIGTGFYEWPSINPDGPIRSFPYPLYQRSYENEKPPPSNVIVSKSPGEYISPRCHSCYAKEVSKRSPDRLEQVKNSE